ncbi:hypothetical protein Ahy_B03g061753 isoform D [Arachis hypogaea]|uniref:C-JID domain-containing protein n=1 Tax=Arachis hypogaea TaxID=3818 RepID=A0A444ZS50_ARAHY|nr:hypothetical protein Ahy_B03g061753 isoform D [Arachis hypogaea]
MQRIRNFIRLKKKKKENARREQGACITNDCEVRERVCGGSYLDNIHNELQVCVIRAYSSSSVLFSEVYKEFTPHISMVFPGIEIPRERELHWVPKKTKQENGEIEKIVKRVIDDVKAMQLMEPYQGRNMTLRAEILSRMKRLEFLQIQNVSFFGSFNSISSELRYLEWKYYPYTDFPSCCKLSKLSKLVLRRSNIKQIWDGTMNGSESSIQCQSTVWSTFKRLKPRLPFHFFNSFKSRYNHVFHMWRLSVARLSCVYYLDLSYCNLHTIPEAISSLHYLEMLVFMGNNIVRVPDFINKLPRLRVLKLDNCKRLMYVDEFPLPLPYPAAERTELVKMIELSMFSCPKIVEKESIQCQSTVWSTFKRLKLRLPFHFFNSSKSRYNRVFHLWRLSVARLSCVYYLDLSYCNLHTIPEAISSLHYLEFLYFTGNNIVRVPDFINKLPRLRVLELDNCKRLMYVDEFPLPLPLPYPAAERTKLVKWGEWRMLNCPKIVEKERLSGMGSSWMREYIKVHNESTGFLAIVIPGSGVPIPRWFKHQNKGADNSMWIESFPNANDNNWIGIALCAQIAVQLDRTISINLYFYDQTGKGNLVYSIFWPKKEEEVRGELVQLCLFYFSRQLLIQDGKQHDLDGSRFEFKVDYQSYVDNERLEVKKWGMRVVFFHRLNVQSFPTFDIHITKLNIVFLLSFPIHGLYVILKYKRFIYNFSIFLFLSALFFHSNQTLTKLPVDSAGVQHPCSIFLLLLLLLSLYAAMLFEYEAWVKLSNLCPCCREED